MFVTHKQDDEEEATHRLSDILVEEVSLVNRAANKRRFLIVKRAEGGNTMSTENAPKGGSPPEGDDKSVSVLLTQEAKNSVATSIADVLEHMAGLADAVKGVDEDNEKGGKVLPTEISGQLKSVNNTLLSLFLEHGLNKSDTASQMVEALVQVAQLSMNLAEDVAVSGEISSETVAKMTQMNGMLGTLISQGPAETPSTDDTDADSANKGDGDESLQVKLDESEKARVSLADEIKELKVKLGESAKGDDQDPPPAEPPKEDSKVFDAITALTEQIGVLVTAQTKAKEEPPAPAPPKEESVTEKLAKQIEEMQKTNVELRSKLDKVLEDPPKGAASGTSIAKGEPDHVIFPESYNDPIHDPIPAS